MKFIRELPRAALNQDDIFVSALPLAKLTIWVWTEEGTSLLSRVCHLDAASLIKKETD